MGITKIQRFHKMFSTEVVGAIDGTHFEIICPDSDSKVDYYSRKQMYTVNTQAVVGADLVFLDIATGFPGSVHDAREVHYYLHKQKGEIYLTHLKN